MADVNAVGALAAEQARGVDLVRGEHEDNPAVRADRRA